MHFHMLGAWQTFLVPQARTWRDCMSRILLLEQRCFEQVSSLKYLMGRVRRWQIYEILWDQELQEEVERLFLEQAGDPEWNWGWGWKLKAENFTPRCLCFLWEVQGGPSAKSEGTVDASFLWSLSCSNYMFKNAISPTATFTHLSSFLILTFLTVSPNLI